MNLTWPDALFTGPEAGTSAHLRVADGRSIPVDVAPWHRAPSDEDRTALGWAEGPVIDVGCGPGRHLLALADLGHEAIGIDVSPAAVRTARRRGAPAVLASVWGPVPRPGHWGTALLLDGNIGIGGDPITLLRRVDALLGPPGRIIVELGCDPSPVGSHVVRVEHGGVAGPWFAWAVVGRAEIARVASESGLRLGPVWCSAGRHFAVLGRPAPPPATQASAQDGRHVAHGARRPA